MSFKRISKSAAKKLFAAGDKPVYLCPCKLYPESQWNVAALVFGKEFLSHAEYYRPTPKGQSQLWYGTLAETAWHLMYNNWAFYNATHETGYYAHYYIEN